MSAGSQAYGLERRLVRYNLLICRKLSAHTAAIGAGAAHIFSVRDAALELIRGLHLLADEARERLYSTIGRPSIALN